MDEKDGVWYWLDTHGIAILIGWAIVALIFTVFIYEPTEAEVRGCECYKGTHCTNQGE